MEQVTNSINIFNSVEVKEAFPVLETYALPDLEKAEEKFSFRKLFASISKKALFFTSVPFYWLVFFTKILNWFDVHFFVFVVVASIVLSFFGKNWGLLNILIK